MIRRIFIVLLSLVLAVALGVTGVVTWSYLSSRSNLAGEVRFVNELAVPPLAESTVDKHGRRVFELTLQEGQTDFGDGTRVRTLGINQSYLGPTVRAARGERVMMKVSNRIGETSTLHWHGMHLPARMDGGPHQMVEHGQTWSPRWEVDQPAATLWYHPHLHGETADQVYRGLAGMFLIDDQRSADLDLPEEYGIDDIPVIVQDKAFDDGELDDSTFLSPVGTLGDRIAVNGTLGAYVEVTTERVRLRLLNASNARVYNFGLVDGRSFDMVATDGGLVPEPIRLSNVVLSPGERAEIVIEMRPGERTVLRSFPRDIAGDFLRQRWSGGDDTLDVLELRAAERLEPSPRLPDELVAARPHDRADVDATRTFRLSTPDINGRTMDMSRIDEAVTVGSTELWEVRNDDGTPHNFHVHDVQFHVLQMNGADPPPHLRGRKDTVLVPANTEMELMLSFTDYTDPHVPYMFHCHILAHEDRGMMGQFVVVEPGQTAGSPTHADHPGS